LVSSVCCRALTNIRVVITHFLLKTHRHSYCECPPDLTGPHCEQIARAEDKTDSAPKVQVHSNLSQKDGTGIITLAVFLAALLLLLTLFVRRQLRRMRRKRLERLEQVANINLQGFRDGGQDQNDEFAIELPRRGAGFGNYLSGFPIKRKHSNLSVRTPSYGVNRASSFALDRPKHTNAFAAANRERPTRPTPMFARAATSQLRRKQSISISRAPPVMQKEPLSETGSSRRIISPRVAAARPRIERSDSFEKGMIGWEMALSPGKERGVEKPSSFERVMDLLSPSERRVPKVIAQRKHSFERPSVDRTDSFERRLSLFDVSSSSSSNDDNPGTKPSISFV